MKRRPPPPRLREAEVGERRTPESFREFARANTSFQPWFLPAVAFAAWRWSRSLGWVLAIALLASLGSAFGLLVLTVAWWAQREGGDSRLQSAIASIDRASPLRIMVVAVLATPLLALLVLIVMGLANLFTNP